MRIVKKKMEMMMQVYEANYVLKLIEENKELKIQNKILTACASETARHIEILDSQISQLFTLLEEKA
jgi:hypothetical protein